MQISNKEYGTKDLRVFYPESLNETPLILDNLINNDIIVNFSKLKIKSKQRLLDLLCGASYACKKSVCPLDNDNYLFLAQ